MTPPKIVRNGLVESKATNGIRAAGKGLPIFRKIFLPVIASLFLFSAVDALQGGVLFEYSGNADPTLKGWTLVKGTSTRVTGAGVISSGVPAWRISDSTLAEDPSGTHNLTYRATQETDAFMEGWSLKASVRFVDTSASISPQSTVNYITRYAVDGSLLSGNNRYAYGLIFGATNDGYLRVGLWGAGTGTLWTATSAADGHNIEFELRYMPGWAGVHFYVNGELIADDYTGLLTTGSPDNYISWGKGGGAAANQTVDYSHISFSTIPESGTTALIALGLLVLIPLIYRRRHGAARG